MSVGVFAFDICITLVIAAYLLYNYGDWMRNRLAVTVSVLVAWYFSFIIIFVLPLDVSNTALKTCQLAKLARQNTSGNGTASACYGRSPDSASYWKTSTASPWRTCPTC